MSNKLENEQTDATNQPVTFKGIILVLATFILIGVLILVEMNQ